QSIVLNRVHVSTATGLVWSKNVTFMNLGAFYVVMLFANKIGSEELDDYTGIGYRSPVLGVCMVLFLISLTGLPPTAGFIGKWYLFIAVLNSNYIWLAVVGVLNSVVSLFYYAKVIRNMFLRGVDLEHEPMAFSPMSIIMLLLLAIPTLVLGIWYGPILDWTNKSVGLFLGN
ncbi:MAG: NADH-quinone oxidoreductase subunit N, partial [Bacteroidetes bacterium]|nr:NADH-quinone oxidoreductase subunit N [Bacteroidota bacterium]